ncbi:hypothetical protein DT849_15875 [Salmonella enterica]|nr:hypothetical protein [Salmonella enterica]EBL9655015.1 hypothetical protein [Salmonella enterica]EBO0996069.1 hypothetical protein [Salmonella enterica]
MYIPFILQVAYVLATLAHPSHIVIYAPGDSLPCRLLATRIILGIVSDVCTILNTHRSASRAVASVNYGTIPPIFISLR